MEVGLKEGRSIACPSGNCATVRHTARMSDRVAPAQRGFARCLRKKLHGCPCGYYGDLEHGGMCSPMLVSRYQRHLSGPLLDRTPAPAAQARVVICLGGFGSDQPANLGQSSQGDHRNALRPLPEQHPLVRDLRRSPHTAAASPARPTRRRPAAGPAASRCAPRASPSSAADRGRSARPGPRPRRDHARAP